MFAKLASAVAVVAIAFAGDVVNAANVPVAKVSGTSTIHASNHTAAKSQLTAARRGGGHHGGMHHRTHRGRR